MISLSKYKGKAVGVFGLGKAGEATVAALISGGARVYAWDDGEKSREALANAHGRKVHLTAMAQWPWEELEFMVLSPGIPFTHPAPHPGVRLAQKHNCAVIGEVELLSRAQPDATYIGITGTNGKSTTTTLIAHILKSAGREVEVGGNLGVPALALKPLGAGGIYVIEMSSYQLDLIDEARFNVAVLLNLTPDHLDRHGDMNGYLAAKLRLFKNQQADDTAVIAVDDEYTRKVGNGAGKFGLGGQHVVSVSVQQELAQGVFVKDGVLHDQSEPGFQLSLSLAGIPTLTGRHNWQNAAVSYAAARAVGVESGVIAAAMKTFPGLAHRLELIAEIDGVRFINDSKATNADATANALAPYAHIYWILGGKPKAGGIAPLAEYFPHIAHAFLIGEAADEFAKTLEGKVKYTQCGTLENAVKAASELAWRERKADAVVLLSPACASFDQFKNFEERGDAFRALTQQLRARHAA